MLDGTGAAGADGPVFDEPLQVVGQLSRRLVAMGRLARHRLQHDRLQVAGDVRIRRARSRKLLLAHLTQQSVPARLVERRTKRQQLVQRQSEAVDVAPGVHGPVQLLGRHVAERADHVARVREILLIGQLGEAEIGNPNEPLLVEQEVAGLDVAVKRALAVGVVQSTGRLGANAGNAPPVGRPQRLGALRARRIAHAWRGVRSGALSFVVRPGGRLACAVRLRLGPRATDRAKVCGPRGDRLELAAEHCLDDARVEEVLPRSGQSHSGRRVEFGFGRASRPRRPQLGQHGVEAAAFDVLHHVEMPALVFAHTEDRHDVRVMEPGRRLRLAAKALQRPRRRGIGGREHLEGHAASERLLLRLVDHAHSAVADDPDDPEVAETVGRLFKLRGRSATEAGTRLVIRLEVF